LPNCANDLHELPTSLAGRGGGKDSFTDNEKRVSHSNLSEMIISISKLFLLPTGDKYTGLLMSKGYLEDFPEPSGITTSYFRPPSTSTHRSHEMENAVMLAIPSLGDTVQMPEDGGEFTENTKESLVG
jgi:hypothetical protein